MCISLILYVFFLFVGNKLMVGRENQSNFWQSTQYKSQIGRERVRQDNMLRVNLM